MKNDFSHQARDDGRPAQPTEKTGARPCFLIAALASFWWPMMAVHEAGHCLAAWMTGGVVVAVELSPLAFSRTDVSPAPWPATVVWAGPILGVILPALSLLILRGTGRGFAGLFCAFCLLANGAYLALGPWDRVGDTAVMLATGSPIGVIVFVGVVMIAAGLTAGIWSWRMIEPIVWRSWRPTLWVISAAGCIYIVGIGVEILKRH